MTTFYPIERPSWWYEPDDDPYTDAEMEMALDDYFVEFKREANILSDEWEKFFENWLEWFRSDD